MPLSELHSRAMFWSTLDPKPITVYDRKHDAYITYWNGLTMTHKQALLMASGLAFNIWPNPKMKEAAFSEFKRLYYSNAFGHQSWSLDRFNADSHFKFVNKKVTDHWKSKLEEFSKKPAEVLGWFNTAGAFRDD